MIQFLTFRAHVHFTLGLTICWWKFAFPLCCIVIIFFYWGRIYYSFCANFDYIAGDQRVQTLTQTRRFNLKRRQATLPRTLAACVAAISHFYASTCCKSTLMRCSPSTAAITTATATKQLTKHCMQLTHSLFLSLSLSFFPSLCHSFCCLFAFALSVVCLSWIMTSWQHVFIHFRFRWLKLLP